MKKREHLRLKMPVLACMLVLLLCGCSKAQWEYRPITDINNMEGRLCTVHLQQEEGRRLGSLHSVVKQ